ncbi:MAG: hypothetical protein CVV58_02995 [Tenericutes bacterium HGW-Tenericutes-3]|nr:MAG: hypothetical protein CVV58_02995 [Tenericutes bacterium HGW-Tenericutes-3]
MTFLYEISGKIDIIKHQIWREEMKEQRYIYKEKAKKLMEGKYGIVIPILLIFAVVQGVISSLGARFQPKYEIDWETFERVLVREGNQPMSLIFSVIAFVVGAIILYSATKMFIQTSNDEKPVIEQIVVAGIKEQPLRTLALQFLIGLYVFLWSLLFVIPGIIKAYAYSMSFYLIQRKPDLNATEAIDMSKKITTGYKSDLFVLDLSYFGWYFLGLFTFGILWLWVAPKHRTAKTLYYNEIYEVNFPKVVIESDEIEA